MRKNLWQEFVNLRERFLRIGAKTAKIAKIKTRRNLVLHGRFFEMFLSFNLIGVTADDA